MVTQRLVVDDQVGTAILDIVRRATKWVVLVSPYLGTRQVGPPSAGDPRRFLQGYQRYGVPARPGGD